MNFMSAVAQIERKLARYPQARRVLEEAGEVGSITVLPPDADGFAVCLTERPGQWTVSYDGWHDDFDSETSAMNCFAFGLSAECRLRVEYRGAAAVKWTVEALADGAWVEDSTVGLLDPLFWRRRTVRYLQNCLIPEDRPRSDDETAAT
jgi:hypothetical protein